MWHTASSAIYGSPRQPLLNAPGKKGAVPPVAGLSFCSDVPQQDAATSNGLGYLPRVRVFLIATQSVAFGITSAQKKRKCQPVIVMSILSV